MTVTSELPVVTGDPDSEETVTWYLNSWSLVFHASEECVWVAKMKKGKLIRVEMPVYDIEMAGPFRRCQACNKAAE